MGPGDQAQDFDLTLKSRRRQQGVMGTPLKILLSSAASAVEGATERQTDRQTVWLLFCLSK